MFSVIMVFSWKTQTPKWETPYDIGQNEVISMFKGETFSNLVERGGGSDP